MDKAKRATLKILTAAPLLIAIPSLANQREPKGFGGDFQEIETPIVFIGDFEIEVTANKLRRNTDWTRYTLETNVEHSGDVIDAAWVIDDLTPMIIGIDIAKKGEDTAIYCNNWKKFTKR